MRKVVKFGGSSLASAEQFKKVGAIIRSDESRCFVVPSAPGKRYSVWMLPYSGSWKGLLRRAQGNPGEIR